MTTLAVILGEDIEQERLHVIVQRLVVQEQLDQETQVLTVDLVGVAVHLVHGHPVLPVDLITRRMSPGTLLEMSLQDGARLHVLQAELAEEELGQPGVLLGVGAGVPGGDVELAKLDHLGSPGVGSSSRTGSLCCWSHLGNGWSLRMRAGSLDNTGAGAAALVLLQTLVL